jgi:N-acyl-D-amino-acid deacylase
MEGFVARHRVPGAALAVTRSGRLAYARGFGRADREKGTPVTPRSLFRIASLSKPVTASAVMLLVQRGRLGLDDPVLPLLRQRLDLAPGDERLAEVTVRRLLRHSGGWDRDRSAFYPLRTEALMDICRKTGVPPPGTPEAVVRYMASRPLDFAPGSAFAYSNVGYLFLGRVVEAVTGRSYPDFVREELLRPMGIRGMHIGASAPGASRPGEVVYYSAVGATVEARFGPEKGRRIPLPYHRAIEVQEAAGGWVASVVDLARFVSALSTAAEGGPLAPETVRRMISATPRPGRSGSGESTGGYALGWFVETDDRGRRIVSHGGRLPGTGAFMGWRSDGIGLALLFNTDATPRNESLVRLCLEEMSDLLDTVGPWPDHDLFTDEWPGAGETGTSGGDP